MSGVYENVVREFESGNIDLINDGLSVMLLANGEYIPDLDNHATLNDVPEASFVSEVLLGNKTLDRTVFRADPTVFTSLNGPEIGAFIIFKDGETFNESTLVFYGDNAPEFPITPDGSDFTIQWDVGVNGIFKI